jgi:hypothetical protein
MSQVQGPWPCSPARDAAKNLQRRETWPGIWRPTKKRAELQSTRKFFLTTPRPVSCTWDIGSPFGQRKLTCSWRQRVQRYTWTFVIIIRSHPIFIGCRTLDSVISLVQNPVIWLVGTIKHFNPLLGKINSLLVHHDRACAHPTLPWEALRVTFEWIFRNEHELCYNDMYWYHRTPGYILKSFKSDF